MTKSPDDSHDSSKPRPAEIEKALEGCQRVGNSLRIRLDRIVVDETQPRRVFSPQELGQLAESLKSKGQIQPCVVRYDADRDRYVLLVGERRFRAAKLAGLETLNCLVDFSRRSDTEKLLAQVIENEQRAELTPLERAEAYQKLIDENGWTAKRLAKELNQHPGTVSRVLALLKLSPDDQQRLERGELSAKQAQANLRKGSKKTVREGQPVCVRTGHGVVRVELFQGGNLVEALAAALKQSLRSQVSTDTTNREAA